MSDSKSSTNHVGDDTKPHAEAITTSTETSKEDSNSTKTSSPTVISGGSINSRRKLKIMGYAGMLNETDSDDKAVDKYLELDSTYDEHSQIMEVRSVLHVCT